MLRSSLGWYAVLHKTTECGSGNRDAHSCRFSQLFEVYSYSRSSWTSATSSHSSNFDLAVDQPSSDSLSLSRLGTSDFPSSSLHATKSNVSSGSEECLKQGQRLEVLEFHRECSGEPVIEAGLVVNGDAAETLEPALGTQVVEVVDRSEKTIEAREQTRTETTDIGAIETVPSVGHDTTNAAPQKAPKKKAKRTVGGVEEDIYESTSELVAWMKLKKREDRLVARAQRLSPYLSTPPVASTGAMNPTPRSTRDEEEKETRIHRSGGQARGGKVRVRPGRGQSGRKEGGGEEERKWAGAEVGYLHIGFVGEVVVLEGVAIKEARRKRK